MNTYKQQFDRLTSAYIRGEVFPFKACACFVGNLLAGNQDWIIMRSSWKVPNVREELEKYQWMLGDVMTYGYTAQEIVSLEHLFMTTYVANHPKKPTISEWTNHLPTISYEKIEEKIDEDALFIAFEATLELLKKIHMSKGEIVDEQFIFNKRTAKECTLYTE